MTDYSQADMLALTPERYLADGFVDAAGAVRSDLVGLYATAAAQQLLEAGVAAQELAFTLEAFRQVLPLHDTAPLPAATEQAFDEALTAVEGMIRQPNNEGLVTWASSCIAQLRRAEDIPALIAHMQAVSAQYSMLAVLSSAPQAS